MSAHEARAAHAEVADGAGAMPNGGEARVAPRALIWRVALGVIWLMGVLLAYYAGHKPATASDLASLVAPPSQVSWNIAGVATRLAGGVGDALAPLGLLVVAGAVGQALWRGLRLPMAGRAESRLIGTLLGLGAIGLTTLALGLLGWLRWPAGVALLVLAVALLYRDILAQGQWWWRAGRAWWRGGWTAGSIERLALVFVAVTAGLTWLAALLPPTAWDALAYHLPVVRADALAGRIVLDPTSPQGYQPQLLEMLNVWLYLARGGDGAAAPLHAAFGGLAVALVALLAWRAGGARTSVRAGALALAIPLVATIAGWAYVDLGVTAFELAAVLALARWDNACRALDGDAARRWLVVAAMCVGLAIDVKYTGVYMLLGLGALVALVVARRPGGIARRVAVGARSGGVFAAVALVVGSPWLLRNMVVAGDPVFPYHLGALFPQGPGWDAGRTAFMEGAGWGWSALWRVPLLPLELSLLGTQHSVEFDATIGPLLLALLPLGLLALGLPIATHAGRAEVEHDGRARDDANRHVFWRWPLACAGVMWLIWGEELARSVVAMQGRLFLAPILALAVPGAVAWLRLDGVRLPSIALSRLANAAVLLCLALTLFGQATQTLQLDNLAELVGAQSREAYLSQQLGPYAEAMRFLDTLGPNARVLFLWEPRTYLTHARADPDAFIDNFNALYRRCGDAAGVTRCLRAEEYTHVLVYREGVEFVRAQADGHDSPAELATLDRLTASLTLVYQDSTPLAGAASNARGWYAVYALAN